MQHYCHVKGCQKQVAPKFLMCAPHWRLVPQALKRDVWRLYRPGQEVTKDPTREYLEAAEAACKYVENLFRKHKQAAPMGSTFAGNPNTQLPEVLPPEESTLGKAREEYESPTERARREKKERERKQTKLF